MAVPPSLRERQLLDTTDPASAALRIGELLAPCRLVLETPREFRATVHGVRLRAVSMLHLDLLGPAALDVGQSGGYYAVHMALGAAGTATAGGCPVELTAVSAMVTNPFDPVLLHFGPNSPQLVVCIEQATLERHLTRMLGHTLTHALVFEPRLDLTSDAAIRWHGALQLLHTEVFHDQSLLRSGYGTGTLEEFVMSTLLLLQPSTYREVLVHPLGPPGRRAVRHAQDYIESHLRQPMTMTQIAEHAGASVRSVQQGFHDELGLTPMTYLRDRRMERVREELVHASPGDGVTVTDVAAHWGFTHLSSFAGLYRRRWGESPSATLRR